MKAICSIAFVALSFTGMAAYAASAADTVVTQTVVTNKGTDLQNVDLRKASRGMYTITITKETKQIWQSKIMVVDGLTAPVSVEADGGGLSVRLTQRGEDVEFHATTWKGPASMPSALEHLADGTVHMNPDAQVSFEERGVKLTIKRETVGAIALQSNLGGAAPGHRLIQPN